MFVAKYIIIIIYIMQSPLISLSRYTLDSDISGDLNLIDVLCMTSLFPEDLLVYIEQLYILIICHQSPP